MSVLEAARVTVSDLVSATVPCSPYYPEQINTPMALVQAADPYLEQADHNTFGSLDIRLEIRIIAPPGGNKAQTDYLDQALTDVIVDLVNADWAIADVSQPYNLLHGARSFTAVSITCSNQIRL